MHLLPVTETSAHEGSRKLPATGRWKNVPGNVQISSQSHVSILIVMDLGVDEGDGCSIDGCKHHHPATANSAMEALGNFPQWGNGRTSQERFKSRCNLTYCQTWEIKRQFQETFRNGAMDDSSGKRFKSCCNLTFCQTWEIRVKFMETSRSGAMEESSGKRFKYVDPTSSAEFE